MAMRIAAIGASGAGRPKLQDKQPNRRADRRRISLRVGAHYHPPVRIAILEDDPDQLALLQRWLVQDGHDVHGYLTGREAMTRATRES